MYSKFFEAKKVKTSTLTIGVFGGMGPLTSAEFYRRLEFLFPANSDDTHPIVYLYSDPTIPRRDVGVLTALNGDIPVDLIMRLLNGMRFFKQLNVDFVVCPCNTFHYFRSALEQLSGIKIINMIEIVAQKVGELHNSPKSITLLATKATAKSGIYQEAFARHQINTTVITDAQQTMVMNIIEGVKCGYAASNEIKLLFDNLMKELETQGSTHVILACTELSLLPFLPEYKGNCTVIDSMDCLVSGVIDEASSLTKNQLTQQSSKSIFKSSL